ncbi:MAG: hypothetical protein EOP09_05965, partial [Proteobacteria bacterium]
MKHYFSFAAFVDWWEEIEGQGKDVVLRDGRLIVPGAVECCRLPVLLRQCASVEELRREIDDPKPYALILMQAGRASVAVGCADEILVSKQIQKYMVRKSQGRAQLNYLNEKGKSRLGSRIRLRQSEEFFAEINARLVGYAKTFELSQLFLSCPPKLKGFWYQSSSPNPFAKKDERWRAVPFMVRPPGEREM